MEKLSELPTPSLIPGGYKISKWPWWAIAIILTGLIVITLILNPTGQVLLVRANETNTYDSFKINSNLKVGVQANSTSEKVALNKFNSEQIKSYSALDTAIQDLTAGNIDAVVMDKASASDYMNNNVGKFKINIRIPSNYNDTFMYLLKGRPAPGEPPQGVYITLRITLISFLSATILGLFAGLARVSKNVVLYNISTLYVEVVRGIPLVVLLLYTAFALFPLFVEATQSIGNWSHTYPRFWLLPITIQFHYSRHLHGRTCHHCPGLRIRSLRG